MNGVGRHHALIIDTDPGVRSFLTDAMETILGMQVTAVGSAEVAQVVLTQMTPDVLIADHRLANSVPGRNVIMDILQQPWGKIIVWLHDGSPVLPKEFLDRATSPLSMADALAAYVKRQVAAGRFSRTVLVVDDLAEIRELIAVVLEFEQFESVLAPDGPTALDVLRTRSVDLVMLDDQMPVMHGLDVLRTMRDEGFDVPVIMMTALDNDAEFIERAWTLGAARVMKKPFAPRTLLNWAAQLTHTPRSIEKDTAAPQG